MNELKKILGQNFSTINRIIIKENEESYELVDSLVFSNENKLYFQILTTQSGVETIFVRDETDLLIDGEYSLEKIEYKNIFKLKNFTVNQLDIFWDDTKSYIIGFILVCNDTKLHFIRLVDEVNFESEQEFYKQIENAKSYTIDKFSN